MSVVAQTPYTGVKRLFEDDPADALDRCDRQRLSSKRARYRASPAGRCFHPSELSYGPSPSNLAALRAIFPDMDDQTVATVLAECGDNIDAAIKRLNELKLSAPDLRSDSAEDDRQRAAASASENKANGTHHEAPGQPDAGPAPSSPASPQHWIETLVQQMTAATSVDDARQRAAHVLHSFEQFTLNRAHSTASSSEERAAQLQAKLEEVLKENHILKRAVQIQNARVQEASQKEQEIQELKQVINQHREQLRNLELSNYSLTLHLQQATTAGTFAHQRNPDVF